MFVDADEEISPELAREIRDSLMKDRGRWSGYIVYRRTYYLGRWIAHGGWNPDYEIRIYDRERGRWEGGLHAKIVVDGEVRTLRNKYAHYNYRDISDQVQTIDTYSTIAANDMLREERRWSLMTMLLNPIFRFLKEYVVRRGFMDGIPGLVIVVSNIYYVFIKYAKLWELEKGLKEK